MVHYFDERNSVPGTWAASRSMGKMQSACVIRLRATFPSRRHSCPWKAVVGFEKSDCRFGLSHGGRTAELQWRLRGEPLYCMAACLL